MRTVLAVICSFCLTMITGCTPEGAVLVPPEVAQLDSCGCEKMPDYISENDISAVWQFSNDLINGRADYSSDETIVMTTSRAVFDQNSIVSLVCRATGGVANEQGIKPCPEIVSREKKDCYHNMLTKLAVVSRQENENLVKAFEEELKQDTCLDQFGGQAKVATLLDDQKTIHLLNKNGLPVYLKQVNGTILKDSIYLENLEGDESPELIFGVAGGEVGSDVGKVFYVGSNGEEKWVYQASLDYPYDGPLTAGQRINNIIIDKDTSSLYVSSIELFYYASQLARLNFGGEVLDRYWHPGYIMDFAIGDDANDDGIKELYFHAVNNDLRSTQYSDNPMDSFSAMGRLPASGFYGQAPPYFGSNDVPTANELYYIAIKPQNIDITGMSIFEKDQTGLQEDLINYRYSCGQISYYYPDFTTYANVAADSYNCPTIGKIWLVW